MQLTCKHKIDIHSATPSHVYPVIRLPREFGVPSLSSARGTNFCDLFIESDTEISRIVVVSAIDNMIKGRRTGGQAIQNINRIFGLDETIGLWSPALSL